MDRGDRVAIGQRVHWPRRELACLLQRQQPPLQKPWSRRWRFYLRRLEMNGTGPLRDDPLRERDPTRRVERTHLPRLKIGTRDRQAQKNGLVNLDLMETWWGALTPKAGPPRKEFQGIARNDCFAVSTLILPREKFRSAVYHDPGTSGSYLPSEVFSGERFCRIVPQVLPVR
jgi:hypothetical protein